MSFLNRMKYADLIPNYNTTNQSVSVVSLEKVLVEKIIFSEISNILLISAFGFAKCSKHSKAVTNKIILLIVFESFCKKVISVRINPVKIKS